MRLVGCGELLSIHSIWRARNGEAADTLAAMPKSFDFQQAPGHLIRRAHQVSVAVFMEETG